MTYCNILYSYYKIFFSSQTVVLLYYQGRASFVNHSHSSTLCTVWNFSVLLCTCLIIFPSSFFVDYFGLYTKRIKAYFSISIFCLTMIQDILKLPRYLEYKKQIRKNPVIINSTHTQVNGEQIQKKENINKKKHVIYKKVQRSRARVLNLFKNLQ